MLGNQALPQEASRKCEYFYIFYFILLASPSKTNIYKKEKGNMNIDGKECCSLFIHNKNARRCKI
jgi:hypothetical protein